MAVRRSALTGFFLVLAVLWLTPAVWVLVTSLKQTKDIVRVPPEWIPNPATLVHYSEVFVSARTASVGRAFLNSTVVAVATVIGVILISALAAYPLARMQFPGRNAVFAMLVGSLMVPNIIGLIPLYILFQGIGWLSTYQALILPELATAFGVFLLRQFFLSLPSELEDAARIDGANSFQVFWRILMPLSQPALAALAIFSFRFSWNDFTWPLIAMNKQEMFTLPVALSLLRGAYTSESYGPIMAGAVVSALPLLIVFLIANRHIVEGVQLSGLKG
ncbi:MAG TPA: carbohydrate ABC transporter permease [Chloroflexota bacterium]|nr:carbohydrate ABC transporter permease [Chloroflexota bacterium]